MEPPPNPMLEMRESLPGEFQEFIRALNAAPSIREFCISCNIVELSNSYNECCIKLKEFRDSHLKLAITYIVTQTKGHMVGTGGTDLVPFLKQVRNETIQAALPSEK
jgi:indoleamine 2,3-dioxygenase